MATQREEDLHLLTRILPGGTRDFIFFERSGDNAAEIINPMELLGLDLAASILERVKQKQPSLSLVLSLCRLLVPCLEYRGSRRHLVVEEWSDLDLRGATLFEDTRTHFARDLAAEQADDYQVITTGEEPPENSLAEIFWDAHTALPNLPDVFEDPNMSSFTKALYYDLVPSGAGRASIRVPDISSRIANLWKNNFQDLNVRPPVRQRRRVFKRILAATVRLASQLNGLVAKALVFERLEAHGRPRDEETLTPAEDALLELRYGGSRALRDINLGLLFGCGPLFAELVNDFAHAHVAGVSPEELDERTERLHQYIFLLGKFRQRRKLARAAERKATRLARADHLPGGPREAARNHPDSDAEQPHEEAVFNEERKPAKASLSEDGKILEAVLPRLKPRDALRLRALIEACGNRERAAESLGLDLKTFSRQLRQTVLKNVKREISEVAAGEGYGSLLEGGTRKWRRGRRKLKIARRALKRHFIVV